jgi:hypothetical protein
MMDTGQTIPVHPNDRYPTSSAEAYELEDRKRGVARQAKRKKKMGVTERISGLLLWHPREWAMFAEKHLTLLRIS